MNFVSIIRILRATLTMVVFWVSIFIVTAPPAIGQEASSEAPGSHNEYLEADGGIDLFTGTATLKKVLYRLPAGNGFGHDITLTYSSNVQMQARAKNDIGAAGWAGLGWRLNPGAIIREDPSSSTSDYSNKSRAFNARTRFYWITPEGGKKRLRPTATEKLSTSYPTFFIEDHPYWRVTYDLTLSDIDSWTLVSPSGVKYTYGGVSSTSSRRLAHGHLFDKHSTSKPKAYQWDLVRIEDGFGNKVDFWWNLDNQSVKMDGTIATEKYTRAAYLSRITTSSGWSADFSRERKTEEEYLDPWTSSAEPDIYQEKYETDRLSKVEIRTPMGEIARIFAFSYQNISIKPQYAFAKSLLSKIIEKDSDGNELPHMNMAYYVDTKKANLQQENYCFGALKSVKYPEGREVEYEYARVQGPEVWNPKAFEVYSEEALDFNLHFGQLDDGSEAWYINAYNAESQWVQIRRWNGIENEIIGNLELGDNSFAVNAIDNGCLLRSQDVPLLYAATWHWGDNQNGPGFQYRKVYEMGEEHLLDDSRYWSYHMRYAAIPSTNVFVLRTEWKDGSIFYLPYYWDGQRFYNRATWKGTDPIGAGSVAKDSKPFFVCGNGYMVIYHLNKDHRFNQYTVATYNLLDHKWDLTVNTLEKNSTPSAFEIIPGTNYFIVKRLNDFVVVTNRGGEWQQQTISQWGYVSTIEPGPDFFAAEVEDEEYNLVTYRWTDAGEWELEQAFSTGDSYGTYGMHASQYMFVAGGSERMDIFSWQNGKDWLRTPISAQNSCMGMNVDGFGVGGRHAVLLATDDGEDDRAGCDRVVAKTAVHTGLPELYRKNLAFTDSEGQLRLGHPSLTVDGSGFAISAYEDNNYPVMRIHKKYQENFEDPAHAYVCTKKTVRPSARSNDKNVYEYVFQPSKTRFDTHTGITMMEEVKIKVPSGGSITKKFYIGVPDSDPLTGSPGMPEYYRGLVQSEETSSEERTISRTKYVYNDFYQAGAQLENSHPRFHGGEGVYVDGWAPGVYSIHLVEKEEMHDNVNVKTEYDYDGSKNGLPSEIYVSTDAMCKETEIEYAFEQISGLEERNMLTLVSKESTYEVDDCKRYAVGRSHHTPLRTLSLEWNKNGTLKHKKLWNGTPGGFTTFTSNTQHDAGRVLESKSGPLVGRGLWTSIIYDRDVRVGSAENSKWEEFGILTCDYDRDGIIDYGEERRSFNALDDKNGWERWFPMENGGGIITLEILPEVDQLFGESCIKVVNAFGPTRNFKIYPKTDYIMSAWVKVRSTNNPTRERFTMGGYFCKSDEVTPEYPYHLPDRPNDGGSTDDFRDFGCRSEVFAPSEANSEAWQYVEMLIPAEKVLNGEDDWYARVFFGTPPNTDNDITGGTAYLQDLRFYPADAIVKTRYYDTKHRKLRVEVDANGNAGPRVIYDGFGRPIKWETGLFDGDHKLKRWHVVREQEYHLAGEGEPLLVPLTPPYGTVAMKSNKAINFEWRVPDQIDVSGPRNYTVYLKKNPSSENAIWELAATVTSETNQREIQISIEGFSCGEAYAWQVFLGGTYSTPIRSFITPSVRVIRPKGGELRQTGDVLEVEYEAVKPENIPLITELSKDAGQTWEPITLDRYGHWLVQGITSPADKCLVRVGLDCYTSDCYPCSDVSDGYFQLTPVTEENLWIIPPEEGEDVIYDLNSCDAIPIRWENVPEGVEAVNIQIRPRYPEEGEEWEHLNAGAPDRPIRRTDPDWGAFDAPVVSHNWVPYGNSGYDWQIRLIAAEGNWVGKKSAYVKVKTDASTCLWNENCDNDCDQSELGGKALIDMDVTCDKIEGEFTVTWSVREQLKEPFQCFDAVKILAIPPTGQTWKDAERVTVSVGSDDWPSKDAIGSKTLTLPFSNLGVMVRVYGALHDPTLPGSYYLTALYSGKYRAFGECND